VKFVGTHWVPPAASGIMRRNWKSRLMGPTVRVVPVGLKVVDPAGLMAAAVPKVVAARAVLMAAAVPMAAVVLVAPMIVAAREVRAPMVAVVLAGGVLAPADLVRSRRK
jgi:hypothetical protein